MNILFLGSLPPHPGGSGVMNWDVLTGLAQRGHWCRALAPFVAEGSDGADPPGTTGIEVVQFPVPYFAKALERYEDSYLAAEYRELAPRLEGLLRAERPDVIFIGRESHLFHVLETAAAHALPTALVTHYGSLPASLLGGTMAPALGRRLIEHVRAVDRVIAVAEHQYAAWKALGVRGLHMIPNAVDCSVFSPDCGDPALRQALGIPAEAIVAMHVSNLKASKRPLDVVESAKRALRRDSRLVYVIAGDGAYRSAMEETCRREGLAGHFRFTGWVPRASVAGLLRLADLLVMTSEEEGRCLACLEAQACGRTVISSGIPAAREIITDGETGLLFRVGDVEDLTRQTLAAAADPALRRAIGARARKAAERWQMNDVISAYEAVLSELVCRREAALA